MYRGAEPRQSTNWPEVALWKRSCEEVEVDD